MHTYAPYLYHRCAPMHRLQPTRSTVRRRDGNTMDTVRIWKDLGCGSEEWGRSGAYIRTLFISSTHAEAGVGRYGPRAGRVEVDTGKRTVASVLCTHVLVVRRLHRFCGVEFRAREQGWCMKLKKGRRISKQITVPESGEQCTCAATSRTRPCNVVMERED